MGENNNIRKKSARVVECYPSFSLVMVDCRAELLLEMPLPLAEKEDG